MSVFHASIPEPSDILKAWTPFKEVLGVTAVKTEEDYDRVMAVIDSLLDETGGDENHPLAEVLDFLASQARAYEDTHIPIPEAGPSEVLRFLMEEHGLKQENLADCAPQGRISDILNGRRQISKEMAKKLAARFKVRADLFL